MSEPVNTLLTDSAEEAARFIHSGGVVAFPTETVYGLGADVFNEDAIAKIFEAKRRPVDNPLIVHVFAVDQIAKVAAEVQRKREEIYRRIFSGAADGRAEKSERGAAFRDGRLGYGGHTNAA